MPWLELTIRTDRREWARLEPALEELGALAVTLRDAVDVPIFEPKPGETPLWQELEVDALFEAGTDRRGLGAVLHELVPGLDEQRLAFREVADADWSRAWMDQFHPMQFGRRLWIYPSTVEPPTDDGVVVVRLDPGLAFGTGTHATTALCLEWLDGLELAGRTVLDFGCGSGVLAIAALKLGAARAIGVDNDPQALLATRDNAERNGVAARLETIEPPALGTTRAEVVVANILSNALVELAPVLLAGLAPGGQLALSGILPEQADAVLAAYRDALEAIEVVEREGWLRIAGRARGT